MTRTVLDSIEEALGVLGTPERLLRLANGRAPTGLERVLHLCRRFPRVARQLQVRHAQRPTLVIQDEHDAQDLIHALLRVDFDDVRPESWAPEYAGKSSRVDFLLKDEQLVLEQKHAHDGKRDIGGELIIDIKRYAEHPHCRTLVCFVYDPDHRLPNPAGIERDLTRKHGELDVVCVVAPT
ncbi:MAG: hypothetical protein K8M05_25235 [Deltaproteobacteria bacterium]|nr:hypothetical protein [Kofleriaceae bacterium]